jgi:hypothetical protein
VDDSTANIPSELPPSISISVEYVSRAGSQARWNFKFEKSNHREGAI